MEGKYLLYNKTILCVFQIDFVLLILFLLKLFSIMWKVTEFCTSAVQY